MSDGKRTIRSAIEELRDRRLNPRVEATAVYFWRRWVAMSVARRVVVTLLTAATVGGTTFAACQTDSITGPSESAGTISRDDALLSGVVNLVSTQKLVSEEVASADPDYIESTQTQFETTDPVYNPCRNETPVLVGKMRVHSRLVFDGLTLKYRLRSWKNTKDVYAEATTYEDHDNDPLTPPEAKKVLYVNQSRELDEFDVGPAGLPFESDQESRIHLVRTREADGVLATDPGDDLFVYARQRVRVNESGVTHEKIEFRTECK